jgi:hypothetical protein
VGYETGTYEGKPTYHVAIKDDDGVVTTWPLSAVLSGVNSEESPVGGRLKLVYAGKEKGKRGQQYNSFTTVEYDDEGASVPESTRPAVGALKGPGIVVPNPADIVAAAKAQALAKARAELEALEKANLEEKAPKSSEYETLLAKLVTINPAMAEALPDVYPDMAVRLEKLRAILKQPGA